LLCFVGNEFGFASLSKGNATFHGKAVKARVEFEQVVAEVVVHFSLKEHFVVVQVVQTQQHRVQVSVTHDAESPC